MIKFKSWVYHKCERIYIKKMQENKISDFKDFFPVLEAFMKMYEKKSIPSYADYDQYFVHFFEEQVEEVVAFKKMEHYNLKHLRMYNSTIESYKIKNKSIFVFDIELNVIDEYSITEILELIPNFKFKLAS